LAVVSQDQLILQRREWKRNGKRVVYTTGAFDLLHPGHIRLLEQARGLGDVLIVGVWSDARVLSEKGAKRPITPAAERAEILAALAAVDSVAVLDDEQTADEFLAQLLPDVLAMGGQSSVQKTTFEGAEAVKAAGGRVMQIPLEPGHSTSRLLDRIQQLRA
jgi:rfaE bifunctional protein nucleotidyltransferase chain/domain